jgi:hypothetical protein
MQWKGGSEFAPVFEGQAFDTASEVSEFVRSMPLVDKGKHCARREWIHRHAGASAVGGANDGNGSEAVVGDCLLSAMSGQLRDWR